MGKIIQSIPLASLKKLLLNKREPVLNCHFGISDVASPEVSAGFVGGSRFGSSKVFFIWPGIFEVLTKCSACFLVVYGRTIFRFPGLANLVALRGAFPSIFVAVPSVNNPTSQ
jgi:hypothetical protein